VTLRDLPLVAAEPNASRVADDIENPRRGIAPRSRGTRHARAVEIRRPRGTRRYNKRGFPRALSPPHLAAKRHALVCAFLYVFLSLSLALPPFARLSPSLFACAPLSLARAREERVRAAMYAAACTDMYTHTYPLHIRLHITRSRVLSKCFCFTYRRRLVNAV